jgi:hypothetical protein
MAYICSTDKGVCSSIVSKQQPTQKTEGNKTQKDCLQDKEQTLPSGFLQANGRLQDTSCDSCLLPG